MSGATVRNQERDAGGALRIAVAAAAAGKRRTEAGTGGPGRLAGRGQRRLPAAAGRAAGAARRPSHILHAARACPSRRRRAALQVRGGIASAARLPKGPRPGQRTARRGPQGFFIKF